VADDRFDLYVNGIELVKDVSLNIGKDGQPEKGDGYDLKPYLLYLDALGNPVDNVIALHATDLASYEYLFVDGVITDAVRLIPDSTLIPIEEGDIYSDSVFRFTVPNQHWRLDAFHPCIIGETDLCAIDSLLPPPSDILNAISWTFEVVPCPDNRTVECGRYTAFAGPGEHYLKPVGGSLPGRFIRASVVVLPVPEPGSFLLVALAIGFLARVGALKTSHRSY
jgi:hypothetical protein